MPQIFLTVVTAIKDGLDLFRLTAPTVLGQSYCDWEWIIVDDGSTEPIEQYVRTFMDERAVGARSIIDERTVGARSIQNADKIRYFRNPVSQGQTKSLNFGIRQSKGNWIVRMDGDDLAHPRRLELIAEAIEANPEAALIFSDYDVIHDDGAEVATVRYESNLSSEFYDYLHGQNNPIAHPTVAFRKFMSNGALCLYDENLRNAQDYALWKSIHKSSGKPFVHIAVPLVKYRLVRQSLTTAKAPEQRRELAAIRENNTARAHTGRDPAADLKGRALDGMYAFRVLFFRFIGHVPEEREENFRGSWIPNLTDIRLAWTALQHPLTGWKGLIYAFGRPVRVPLKRKLFRGIFK